ncbi:MULTISPECIES: hypothetical protein [Micromonospora]|uniref:hypothetical protein n=1 Tax=Micromonospora TaxID=1873 RepID=UPI00098D2531|nr:MULTISPECIES: hypothetical protein [unclassified Micromonospora]OON30782.1 hypothetical protein BSA16_14340 [Micromonospora sp. Rc5]
MSGDLFVDPEGLGRLGDQYRGRADAFRQLQAYIEALRHTYGTSWGTDDLGQQFAEKFVAGLLALENIVGAAADTLDYTADGLTVSGTTFRGADDDAYGAGRKLGTVLGNLRPNSGTNPATDNRRYEKLRPALLRTVPDRLEPERLRPGLVLTVPAGTLSSSVLAPALPPDAEVMVGGVPVGDHQQVVYFREVAPGTVRVDTNHYRAITPLPPGTDVRLGGTPFEVKDGYQLFLVERAPADDPPAGPTYVDYHPDGTSEPYGTAQG